MGMWLPNMQRLGPNISTSGIIQGFNCSSFQFMPKMHSTAEMLTPVLPHRLMASKSVCPSPLAIDAKINRPAHYCNREANFWILADHVQEIGQLRGEHFQSASQIRSLEALKTLQPLWVRYQIGPWSEAAKRIVVVPSDMLAHGSQVRKRAVDIQALWQVWIAEVNQANKRNWDFRSCSQLLRPPHLLDGSLGNEFVPDEAVYLPRAGCSEIVIEKVSPRQRGVIPDKSFKSRVFPCKNTVAVGSAVVEMSVCIDDCCPAGERASCHDRTASPSRQQNRCRISDWGGQSPGGSVCRQTISDSWLGNLRECLAHLVKGSGCDCLLVQAASLLDGFSFDLFPPFKNGLTAPEVDVSRRQVVQALVISTVVVVPDELLDALFELSW